jgi:hypothetical protein
VSRDSEEYGFNLAMYEALELVIEHCEKAKDAEGALPLGVQLKMASRAMRCALEIYEDHIRETPK